MSLIKPIIGIIGKIGMSDENQKIFNNINCDTVLVSNILDLESCDALVFPSAISNSLKHFIGDNFLNSIFIKIQTEDFPVWLMGQSIELFSKKLFLESSGSINDLEEEVVFDFLDTKPFKIKIFNTNIYHQKKSWFNFFQKNAEEIGFTDSGLVCAYQKNNLLITNFSPEFTKEERLYEFFINKFIV